MWDIPFAIHTPAGMTGIWTLKLLSALFEKWNLKSLFFIGMFEKNLPSLVGGGGGIKMERPCNGLLFCSL